MIKNITLDFEKLGLTFSIIFCILYFMRLFEKFRLFQQNVALQKRRSSRGKKTQRAELFLKADACGGECSVLIENYWKKALALRKKQYVVDTGHKRS